MTFLERLQLMQFGWRDALDILIVAFILYNFLVLIRGTRAMQMALGLAAIAAAYLVARELDLLALEALSRDILFYLPFAVIVLFQHEIRRALASLGKTPGISHLVARQNGEDLTPVVVAALQLSHRKIGALIAIERTQSLRMYGESGKLIDAKLSADLLVSIFTPTTPLHDGAVIVHGDRIVSAGCFLPLSSENEISKEYGTRHRAALGVSEETDALVVVISEENGSMAAALEGALYENLDAHALDNLLRIYGGGKDGSRR